MKKITLLLFTGISLFLTSCIKQIDKEYQGPTVVEMDQTVLNSNATGVTFPILTRIPVEGRPLTTTHDSTLRRFSGLVKLRINLVGPQSVKEETIGYKIFSTPITSISFPATLSTSTNPAAAYNQTPSRASGTLTVLDAIAGTHYSALSGKVTIPAKSSFGYVNIQVLDAGATAGQARFLGIQLDSTGSVMPNPNYNKIGLVIDQR